MQQKKTYTLVGLFVVVGFICLGGIVFHYLGRQFTYNTSNLAIMYFEESISGLSVGSAVVFKGVEVGKVERIRLMANLKKGTFKTPVYISFDPKKAFSGRKNYEGLNKELLDRLIAKGLRARLTSANYLTGQLMIELIMDAEEPAVFRGTGKYVEIPTELSPYEMFSNDLKEIPLRETLMRFGDFVADLDEKFPVVLQNVEDVTSEMRQMLGNKSNEVSKTLNNLNSTLEEVSKASRSIKNLTDYLERHPEAIIQGKGK